MKGYWDKPESTLYFEAEDESDLLLISNFSKTDVLVIMNCF
jgi:hypothetical protein